MPNDTEAYHVDSFVNMKRFSAQHGFTFPHIIDRTRDVARAYGAECTPDFFGFNSNDELPYRGRLDAARTKPVADARRNSYEAMKQVADTGRGPKEQFPSMGCSIKFEALSSLAQEGQTEDDGTAKRRMCPRGSSLASKASRRCYGAAIPNAQR